VFFLPVRVLSRRFRRLYLEGLQDHSMRHSTAVYLLKPGVDLSTIGQWLGHDSLNTTNKYVTIDLDLKRQVLAQADSPATEPLTSWRHDATILEWLEAL
jgi:site-specific recombinase XerD